MNELHPQSLPKRPWRPLTRLLIVAFCLLAFALQVGPSRQAYVSQAENGWRGGVRHGAPFVVWDSGMYYSATPKVLFKVEEYGGMHWGGVCANVAVTGLGIYLLVVLSELLHRRREARAPKAASRKARQQRIRPATAVVCCMILLGLLGQNLQLYTTSHIAPDGKAYYTQRMGWPYTFYRARGPMARGFTFDTLADLKPDAGVPVHTFSAVTTHAVPVDRIPTAVAGLHNGFPLPPISNWNYEWLGVDLVLCSLLALVACAVSEMLIVVFRPRADEASAAASSQSAPAAPVAGEEPAA